MMHWRHLLTRGLAYAIIRRAILCETRCGWAIVSCSISAYPDDTQFDPASPYFDAKSTRENPRWMLVNIKAIRKTRLLGLPEMRACEALAEMQVLKKGSRLSITPVTAQEWAAVMRLLDV
jgi:predicted RNA-binding protein with PUA-like domain